MTKSDNAAAGMSGANKFSRRLRIGAAAVALTAVVLSGCASEGKNANSTANNPVVVAKTEPGLPGVSGKFGELPKIDKGQGQPPKELKERVLIKGNGPAVGGKDIVTVNYLGQTWPGVEFDKSFGRAPATFQLTGVIKGWTQGLTGKHVGDRVELVIPPDLGYGNQQVSEKLPANSTLVFVVDILGRLNPDDESAVKEAKLVTNPKLPAGLKIEGALGTEPKIITNGFKMPQRPETIVIAQGTGKPLGADDQILVNITEKSLDSGKVISSYTAGGAQLLPQPIGTYPELLTVFTGVPVGSRIVYLKPGTGDANSAPGSAASIMVFDILGAVATK